jgi:hypothetical protein
MPRDTFDEYLDAFNSHRHVSAAAAAAAAVAAVPDEHSMALDGASRSTQGLQQQLHQLQLHQLQLLLH